MEATLQSGYVLFCTRPSFGGYLLLTTKITYTTNSFKKKDAVGHPFLFYGLTLKSGGITKSVRFLAPLFSTFVSSGFEPAIPNFSLVSPHDAIKLTANNKTKSLLIVLFLHESFVV